MQQQQKDNKIFIVLTVAFTVLILGICWILKSKQKPSKEDTSTKQPQGNNVGTHLIIVLENINNQIIELQTVIHYYQKKTNY